MGQKGVPTPLVAVVEAGEDLNTIGQAVSALRRLASNADNAVGMVRVRGREVAPHEHVVLATLQQSY